MFPSLSSCIVGRHVMSTGSERTVDEAVLHYPAAGYEFRLKFYVNLKLIFLPHNKHYHHQDPSSWMSPILSNYIHIHLVLI